MAEKCRVRAYASWIAFILLLLIGSKIVYESISGNLEKDIEKSIANNIVKDSIKITHKVILVLAVATSIDALAADFTLTILDVNVFVTFVIIGLTTLIVSSVGLFIGAKSGTWLENKAVLLAGIVLVLIGFKLLFISLVWH